MCHQRLQSSNGSCTPLNIKKTKRGRKYFHGTYSPIFFCFCRDLTAINSRQTSKWFIPRLLSSLNGSVSLLKTVKKKKKSLAEKFADEQNTVNNRKNVHWPCCCALACRVFLLWKGEKWERYWSAKNLPLLTSSKRIRYVIVCCHVLHNHLRDSLWSSDRNGWRLHNRFAFCCLWGQWTMRRKKRKKRRKWQTQSLYLLLPNIWSHGKKKKKSYCIVISGIHRSSLQIMISSLWHWLSTALWANYVSPRNYTATVHAEHVLCCIVVLVLKHCTNDMWR